MPTPIQGSLLSGAPFDVSRLPSPKMRPQDKAGVHTWTNFYAAFSERFVSAALDAAGACESDVVLDPFCGSGTTIVAALRRGMSATGVDLDPFACLLARAKIATLASRRSVLSLLAQSRRKEAFPVAFHPSAENTFSAECLSYAAGVFEKILTRTGADRSNILHVLLDDIDGQFDSEIVALTAMSLAASRAAKLVQGSNPTWFRQAQKGEPLKINDLKEGSVEHAESMIADIRLLSTNTERKKLKIVNTDLTTIPSGSLGLADYIVTSPPYLTRMDYVVKHLPNLLLLTGLISIDIEQLRRRMIGTSKINEKGRDSKEWGRTCLATMRRINTHPSYASSSYYVWTYRQYFSSLHQSLIKVCDVMRQGGAGFVVIQDGQYKDLHIPLGIIANEMLSRIGVQSRIVASFPVKNNLRRLNPALAMTQSAGTTAEHVVHFTKP